LSVAPDIEGLAGRILQHRAGRGIRETAKEVGVSPATLSRVENGKIPDLETFGKICAWLGDDPARYLGTAAVGSQDVRKAQVHFKKGAAIEKDSAQALSEMILAAQRMMLAEEIQD
jgi:transcriptional regulator with XRE-family HTH domain